MNTVEQVMAELERLGSAQTRKTFARHGAPIDKMFGVKVGDMKKLMKPLKNNQALALQLYETGNSDAMYLAGLLADGSKMTKKQLEAWVKQAPWHMISEYSVAWVTSEHPEAAQISRKWIDSKTEKIAASGWATYASLIAIQPDSELDLAEIDELMQRATANVHRAPGRVAYTMNNFVICVGSYVKPLLAKAKAAAKKMGVVEIDMGDTSCKVPLATEYIAKIESMSRIGQKRKMVRC